MKPLLAHVYEPHRVTFPCFIQPKFNGVRALYQAGRFQSRDELPWHPDVLRHIAEPLLAQFGPDVVFDGELYVHGWPLQRINGAVQIARSAPREDTHEVRYVIFDRVDFMKSFKERFFEPFAGQSDPTQPFAFALTQHAGNETVVNAFYSRMVSEAFEGIMYRLGDCPYTTPKQTFEKFPLHDALFANQNRTRFLADKNNRVWHLLKRKAWQDGEFECIAIEEGLGKRAGKVGAFVCEQHILGFGTEQFRVGSGITDLEAQFYFEHPEQVVHHKIKIKFLTLTERGVPFNPTIETIL